MTKEEVEKAVGKVKAGGGKGKVVYYTYLKIKRTKYIKSLNLNSIYLCGLDAHSSTGTIKELKIEYKYITSLEPCSL